MVHIKPTFARCLAELLLPFVRLNFVRHMEGSTSFKLTPSAEKIYDKRFHGRDTLQDLLPKWSIYMCSTVC